MSSTSRLLFSWHKITFTLQDFRLCIGFYLFPASSFWHNSLWRLLHLLFLKTCFIKTWQESYFSGDLNLGSTWLPIILVVCHLVYTDGNDCCFCCAWMVQTENPVSLRLLWRKHKEIILVSKDSAPNNTVHRGNIFLSLSS